MLHEEVVHAKKLTKRYGGIDAVKNVSFTVKEGEIVGFVGLNGAGKSTTINMILGFIGASKGSVAVFGQTVTPASAHKVHHRLGFASGDMSLPANLKGTQYFDFIANQYKLENTSRLHELIERFQPELNKKIGNLSRGNKQKIALIAAFMTSPDLVVLDEPSSGLDPLMQQQFLGLVREEAETGTTIFMSSHYLTEVVEVCSRVLVIKNGQIIKDIPASDLLEQGGKRVMVITEQPVAGPKKAEHESHEHTEQGYRLEFVYTGTPAQLKQWFDGVTRIVDVSITDHTAEAAFSDLYGKEETSA